MPLETAKITVLNTSTLARDYGISTSSARQRRPSMAGRKKRRIGAFSRRLSLQLQATKDPQWHRVFTETL